MILSPSVLETSLAHPVFVYLVLASVVTFLLFGFDKVKARSGWWRIPEKTLLCLCLLGGTLGGGAAMLLFRHKTSKPKFLSSFFAITALQAVAMAVWWWYVR